MNRTIFSVLFWAAAAPMSMAQVAVVPRPYDGIQAGLDAFRLAEEQRQVAVAQQLQHNDLARFYGGFPTSRGATIYYGYLSREAAYAYGYGPPISSPFWPPPVFEPWPYVPGDIYGYPMNYLPARQPIGQTQLQTGPNRWESHPVYDPPLTAYMPLPPLETHSQSPNVGWAVPTAPGVPADVELVPPPPPSSSGETTGVTPLTPAPFPRPRTTGPREY